MAASYMFMLRRLPHSIVVQDISGEQRAAKRKLAVDSLAQLEEYTNIDKKSPDWQVFLKGACN